MKTNLEKASSQEPFHTLTEIDDDHDGHQTYQKEVARDNPVEFTEWRYCVTCDKEYAAVSITLIDNEEFVV